MESADTKHNGTRKVLPSKRLWRKTLNLTPNTRYEEPEAFRACTSVSVHIIASTRLTTCLRRPTRKGYHAERPPPDTQLPILDRKDVAYSANSAPTQRRKGTRLQESEALDSLSCGLAFLTSLSCGRFPVILFLPLATPQAQHPH